MEENLKETTDFLPRVKGKSYAWILWVAAFIVVLLFIFYGWDYIFPKNTPKVDQITIDTTTTTPPTSQVTPPPAPSAPSASQAELERLKIALAKKDLECENANLKGQIAAYKNALKKPKNTGSNTGTYTAPPANTTTTPVNTGTADCAKTITTPLTATTETVSGRAPNSFYEDNKIKFCIRIGKSEKVWLPQRLSDINLTSPNAFDNRQGGANWEFLATNGSGPNPNEAVVSTDGTVWVPASWVQQIANMQSIEPIAELNGKMTGWGCQQMTLEGDYYIWRYKK